MTQFPPGVYCYVKWWDGGTILQTKSRRNDENGNTRVALISSEPVSPAFLVFLVPQLSPLPGFDVLTIFNQKGANNTGYAWPSPYYGLVKRRHDRLSNQC